MGNLKWTAIFSRYGVANPFYDLFDSKDEAVRYLLSLNNVYAIAVVSPEKDKYWTRKVDKCLSFLGDEIADTQDLEFEERMIIETNLRETGLAAYAEFKEAFEA